MIERIQIQNFQAHGKLRAVFDDKVTTIVGPSDAGKSSLLRAIRWVVFNRPLGDGFIRDGEDACSVKLWVDGTKIERRKNGRENAYLVDEEPLKAVGTGVPDGVAQVLNLVPENFQGQHDPPFWFSLTPGEVAKRLNAIVDLEVIDRSASWLGGLLRSERSKRDVVEERLNAVLDRCQELAFVDDMENDFQRLQKKWDDLCAQLEKRDRLKLLLESAQKTAADVANKQSAAVDIAAIEEQASLLMDNQDTRDRLQELVESAKTAFADADRMRGTADQAEQRLKDKLGGVCPVCGGEYEGTD